MSKTKDSKIIEQFNKLSKRELVLIYLMLVVIILAGGVMLLIKPAIDTHDAVSAQLMTAQQEKDAVDMMIAQIPILENEISNYQKNIKKLKKQFNEVLVNEDIDSLVTGMITSSGLKPVSLQIGASRQEAWSGETVDTGASSDTASAENEASSEPAVDEVNNSVVKTTAVTVKAKGTMAQFTSLIGRVVAQKGVILRGFTINGQENEDSAKSVLSEVLDTKSKKTNYPYEAEFVLEVNQSKSV